MVGLVVMVFELPVITEQYTEFAEFGSDISVVNTSLNALPIVLRSAEGGACVGGHICCCCQRGHLSTENQS